MPVYFQKLWHSGEDRDSTPGEVLDPQPDWAKPEYRPGWKVKYKFTRGDAVKTHIGIIRYVFREKPQSDDFYVIIRSKTGEEEITMLDRILARVEE